MRQVIKSDAESSDGVSIEREQPSTALKSMGVFAKLDGITGRTIPQGDLTLEVLDSASLVQQDGQIFHKAADGQLLGPLGGEGVFKPQDIDAKGSVIVGDNHFMPGRGGDSLTGEGRSTKIWTTGGASTFEDRMPGHFDGNDFHACPNIVLGTEAPSMSMHQGAMNSINVGDAAGNLRDAAGNTPDRFRVFTGGRFEDLLTETFEPLFGMDSFGESPNPVLEIGSTAGPGGTSSMTGKFDFPADNVSLYDH